MKVKYIYTKIAVTLMLLSVVSCDNWLYLEPENDLVRQEFWKTGEQVNAAVIGCYTSFNQAENLRKFFYWGELRGDLIDAVNCNADEMDLLQFEVDPNNQYTKWNTLYETINLCNTVIAFGKDALKTDITLTPQQLNAYVGEARFMRSYLYFMLVRTFGDVPLKLDPTTSDRQNMLLARTPQRVVLDSVISDLNIAAQTVPVSYLDVRFRKGRVTRAAVYALQADVYLWDNQYQKCIDACDNIINYKFPFGLEPGNKWLLNLFTNGNSETESILELQNNTLYGAIFGITASQKFTSGSGCFDIFIDPTDYRGSSSFSSPNSNFLGSLAANSAGMVDVYKFKADVGGQTGYKPIQSWQVSKLNYIVYRYAEILLFKAEALNELDRGAEALSIIETIQTRANMAFPPTADASDKTSIQNLIIDERARELAYEGRRWFDLLRFAKRNKYEHKATLVAKIAGKMSASNSNATASKLNDTLSYFLPINQTEIEVNSKLVQNPFYLKHQ